MPEIPGKILIVSGNPNFLREVQVNLKNISADIQTASAGSESLKKLKETGFDFLVVDSNLKDISAEKLIKKIVSKSPTTDITLLITGESGTGKELIARAVHKNSLHKDKPFIAVNCGALAEGVLESELFGHEKGSFTGAISRRAGVFELAEGGTIFLDEIGEIKPSVQVKILRVLEEKEIMRVWGTQKIKGNVRVLAATKRDLSVAVEEGNFRRDLYYRIGVVKIEVPPLRERIQDIPILVHQFIKQINANNKDQT